MLLEYFSKPKFNSAKPDVTSLPWVLTTTSFWIIVCRISILPIFSHCHPKPPSWIQNSLMFFHIQSISKTWKLFLYIQQLLTANSGFLITAIFFLIKYILSRQAPTTIIQNMDRGFITFSCPFNQMESLPRSFIYNSFHHFKKKVSWCPFWPIIFIAYQNVSSDIQWAFATCLHHWAISFSNKNLCSHPCWSSLTTAPDLPFPLLFWSCRSLALRKPKLRFLKVKKTSLFLIGVERLHVDYELVVWRINWKLFLIIRNQSIRILSTPV